MSFIDRNNAPNKPVSLDELVYNLKEAEAKVKPGSPNLEDVAVKAAVLALDRYYAGLNSDQIGADNIAKDVGHELNVGDIGLVQQSPEAKAIWR